MFGAVESEKEQPQRKRLNHTEPLFSLASYKVLGHFCQTYGLSTWGTLRTITTMILKRMFTIPASSAKQQ